MSGGNTTLMRTRCPECATIFRVTSEQLRRKAGKVRCGQCQHVFNAFDHWLAEGSDEPQVASLDQEGAERLPSPPVLESDSTHAAIEREVETTAFDPDTTLVAGRDWLPPVGAPEAPEPIEETTDSREDVTDQRPEAVEPPPEVAFDAGETLIATPADHVMVYRGTTPVEGFSADEAVETPEQSTLAARNAGLVAARELPELASYNRWSAGTLASDGSGVFDGEKAPRANWPFVLVSVVLVLALFVQALYYYRTEISVRLPALGEFYGALGVDVPLPRNPALVSIETSDLQSDNARGLYVLQATLKNRAAYPQAWPALELSLTDTNDAVVSRRVLYAAEYLPPGTVSDEFPVNSDVAVRLWIEAKGVSASGYRLYIFYP